MARSINRHQHILISDWSKFEDYAPRRPSEQEPLPPRQNRTAHGRHLRGQLEAIEAELGDLEKERLNAGVGERSFVYVEFESHPDSYLTLRSLDDRRSGIELVAVHNRGDRMIAAVYIPDDKIGAFFRRIDNYLDATYDSESSGRPKNANLIDSIANLRRAVLNSLWTDDHRDPPQDDSQQWWEVWIRAEIEGANSSRLKGACRSLNIVLASPRLAFPEREVVLLYASRTQLEELIKLYDLVAEIRAAETNAEYFVSSPIDEQRDWSVDLESRIVLEADKNLRITLLDTGVNASHPLLRRFIDDDNLHSLHPDWGADDWHGHGTCMAGISLYGDLSPLLDSTKRIRIGHILESVKLFPPGGTDDETLYGFMTQEAVARARTTGQARRVVHMSITNDAGPVDGCPTSWSAAIDQVCYGGDIESDDEMQTLFLISAGNTLIRDSTEFPNSNIASAIEDPAQAWNCLTVGGVTFKSTIREADLWDWAPLAGVGDMSPFTRTSVLWDQLWPLKPDVVFEGGNLASNPSTNETLSTASLSLLSIGHRISDRLFVDVRETSAATAQAAKLAAEIWDQYPNLWPESVRALLVHSARWTDSMVRRFGNCETEETTKQLVRTCGWGVPDFDRAVWSVDNELSMIAENTIQPYHWVGSDAKSHEMVLHSLPWPREVLQSLSEAPVQMRVTLSYFVEPNPARTGWKYKHLYQSHGLRFRVKAPTESIDDFRKRVNVAARDADWVEGDTPDYDRWSIGRVANRGSLHSDIWSGTAAELAEKSAVAVYPIVGWWRERKHLERVDTKVRYCLIVSIEAPDENVDLYTPIAIAVSQSVTV